MNDFVKGRYRFYLFAFAFDTLFNVTQCQIHVIKPVPKWHVCNRLNCRYRNPNMPYDRLLLKELITTFLVEKSHKSGEIFIFEK